MQKHCNGYTRWSVAVGWSAEVEMMGWTPLKRLTYQSGGVVSRQMEGFMTEISTIGLDLAKNVLQAHGADAASMPVFRKKLRRDQMLALFPAQLL